jgi:FCD domain
MADPHAVGAFDERFHGTLVAATGNAEIARVHQDVTDRIRIVRRLDFTRADRIEATYVEHAKILRAVIRRKADEAQWLLKSHIEQSKVEVRKITLHALHEARSRQRALVRGSCGRGSDAPIGATPSAAGRPSSPRCFACTRKLRR